MYLGEDCCGRGNRITKAWIKDCAWWIWGAVGRLVWLECVGRGECGGGGGRYRAHITVGVWAWVDFGFCFECDEKCLSREAARCHDI